MKKIYPYLIKEQKINEYYEFLMENKYNLKIFDKKKDKEIYKFFLPKIRDFMFWTFNLKNDKKSFKELSDSIKVSIINNYNCNIFKNADTIVICFDNGICFAISEDKDEIRKIKNHKLKLDMNQINLRDELSYEIPTEIPIDEGQEYLYLYILQLYKMIYMHVVLVDIQEPSKFNRVRNDFVTFVKKVINTKATDNEKAIKVCEKWEEKLDLESLQIKIDNQFDLLYKNNKLNDNIKTLRVCILLFAVAIIIGIINLLGMIQ